MPVRLLPRSEYHEDHGFVIWWRVPINEPPWVGTPNCSDWPEAPEDDPEAPGLPHGYYTHWCPLPEVEVIDAG